VELLSLLAAAAPAWAELRQDTLSAWNSYIQTVEARTNARLEPKRSFLWIDEDSARRSVVRNGEIVVDYGGANALHPVNHGLIHDWMGGMFIAGASINDVFAVVRDYGQYREIFKPTVVASADLGARAEYSIFSMQWTHTLLFLTAALDAQYESRYFQFDSTRWYSLAYSTRLQEIVGYGSGSAQTFPPDQGPGFLWRLYGVTRYQQRDGGVYVESEVLALSRDIPLSVRWFVKPATEGLSRRSFAIALQQIRDAVRSRTSPSGLERRGALPQASRNSPRISLASKYFAPPPNVISSPF